jgi:hypothetical protein
MVDQATIQAAHQLINSDSLFAENFILIEDRNGVVIPLKYNRAQLLMESNLTGRDIILKPRQMGITSLFLFKGFKKTITQDNITAVVVAHEEFTTQRLLHKVQIMYDRLPMPDNMKPVMHHNSSYEKSFPSRNSVFYIGTAGSKVFGRGETIKYFLGSEFAFWPDPWKILNPVMQSVPLDGEIILESTPNGEGGARTPNAFYELVQESLNTSNNVWNLQVIEWYLEDAYRIARGSKHALEKDRGEIGDYNNEELGLISIAGWDDREAEDRIRWRRRKFSELKALFYQEYLEDIVSCFMTVKEPFYDYEVLDRLRAGCFPAPHRFNHAEVWNTPVDRDSIEEESQHPIYVISVDPGQGKGTRSVALVWRLDLEEHRKIRHEATLSGFYDPVAFAGLVTELGKYYYDARIIPEANGHGLSFCSEIKHYPNLYYRTDIISGIQGKHIGWMTTGSTRLNATGTKMFMLTELQTLLPIIEMHDINLIRELMQVRYTGDKVVFMGSDDYHDSAAIMAATRGPNVNQRGMKVVGQTGWKDGWGR